MLRDDQSCSRSAPLTQASRLSQAKPLDSNLATMDPNLDEAPIERKSVPYSDLRICPSVTFYRFIYNREPSSILGSLPITNITIRSLGCTGSDRINDFRTIEFKDINKRVLATSLINLPMKMERVTVRILRNKGFELTFTKDDGRSREEVEQKVRMEYSPFDLW